MSRSLFSQHLHELLVATPVHRLGCEPVSIGIKHEAQNLEQSSIENRTQEDERRGKDSHLQDATEVADLNKVEGGSGPHLLDVVFESTHHQQPNPVHCLDKHAAVEVFTKELDIRNKVVQQAA